MDRRERPRVHGLIFAELQDFVIQNLGEGGWKQVVARAGLQDRVFLPITSYPDADAEALVSAGSELTGKSRGELLVAFGEHLAPHLLHAYDSLLRPGWRTLDVLEHVEDTIHRIVRLRESGAMPPRLVAERRGNVVAFEYQSPRRMCQLAIGIARGLAAHYEEVLSVVEKSCTERGAQVCSIEFRLG
jgi:hypothetical protein